MSAGAPPRRRWASLPWLLGIGVVGAFAASNGAGRLDAVAGSGAALDVHTPGLGPILARAQSLLDAGRTNDAMALAARAVRAAPLDQGAVRAYGLMQLAAGDAAGADPTMRAAGALGWRDVRTDLFWADVAMRTGDLTVAAQRLDAAMRVGRGGDAAVADRVRAIEAAPDGIAALVARMPTADDWRQPYLNDVGAVADAALPRRAALIRALAAAGSRLDPFGAPLIQRSLIGRLRPDLARAVWETTAAPGDRGRTPADPDFAGAAAEREKGPFDWSFPGAPGLEVRVGFAPAPLARPALNVRADSPIAIVFATQTLALAPGAWTLLARTVGARTPRPIDVELACFPQQGSPPLVIEPAPAGVTRLRFAVTPGCQTQQLTLLVSGPEARGPADFWIGDVRVDRAATAVSR